MQARNPNLQHKTLVSHDDVFIVSLSLLVQVDKDSNG